MDEDSEAFLDQIKDMREDDNSKFINQYDQSKIATNLTRSLSKIDQSFIFTRIGVGPFQKHKSIDSRLIFELNSYQISQLDSRFKSILNRIPNVSLKKKRRHIV